MIVVRVLIVTDMGERGSGGKVFLWMHHRFLESLTCTNALKQLSDSVILRENARSGRSSKISAWDERCSDL